jgi:heme exporter protein CcmD
MGQYNMYITAAYGVAGFVLFGLILHARFYRRKQQRRLKQWYRLFLE